MASTTPEISKHESAKDSLTDDTQSKSEAAESASSDPMKPAVDPPKDRFYLTYVAFFLAGAGFLFPWNSFVAAVDYFLFLYPDKHPEVAIAVTYLLVTLTFSTVNIGIVHCIPLHGRIGFGYFMFTIALVFVPLLDIAIQNCALDSNVSFFLTLCAVFTVGIGSGLQQSSYYGLSGMLPPRYTQAVMAGESAAGLVVSLNRVVTKVALTEMRSGVIAFFVVSVLFILLCVGCQVYIGLSPFVRHYVVACRQNKPHNNSDTILSGGVSTCMCVCVCVCVTYSWPCEGGG